MQIDLTSNFFELFGFESNFNLDDAALVERFNDLQRHLHPDKFAARPDSERRWSMQAASLVNQGYQTLRSELPRASYLLKLNGIDVDDETDTRMDPAFLMEQMELRESLELAEQSQDPPLALADIRKQLKTLVQGQVQVFTTALEKGDWEQARITTRQWQFLDKLLREIKELEERLDV